MAASAGGRAAKESCAIKRAMRSGSLFFTIWSASSNVLQRWTLLKAPHPSMRGWMADLTGSLATGHSKHGQKTYQSLNTPISRGSQHA